MRKGKVPESGYNKERQKVPESRYSKERQKVPGSGYNKEREKSPERDIIRIGRTLRTGHNKEREKSPDRDIIERKRPRVCAHSGARGSRMPQGGQEQGRTGDIVFSTLMHRVLTFTKNP